MASYYRTKRKHNRLIADLVAILVLLALVVIVYRYAGSNEQITGNAQIIDGDTVAINGLSIRLISIDAPERKQTCQKHGVVYQCGVQSTRALKNMIGNQNITCHGWQKDIYQRLLATCYLSNQQTGAPSLNQKMVRSGWAVSYNDFIADERMARSKKRGIWAGEFQHPSDWRIENRRADELQENVINTVWQWIKNIAGL